ncbi:MAG: transcriptional regulator [Desulfobacteraceae bacterium]|nr:transcriptional regulator [Desulfobacteraceae bacterium]
MDVLHSKLQAPKRYHILHRNRLNRLFEEICQNKLVAVTAGAGYGKTTLVTDALESLDVVPAWYRLDEQDGDFPVFITYLYSAIQRHFPDPNEIVKEPGIPKTSLRKQTDTLIEWLAFVEKTVTRQTVLVLDDYHLVRDSQQINHAIEFILARLPDRIHLVIIGRKNMDLRLSSLRAKEQLLEIGENDLSFTTVEIKRFFSDTLLETDRYIKDIHSSTGGWAASLVLLRYTFHKKTPETIADSLALFKQTPRYIFSYLKENVFDPQPDHIKAFMMKAALLDEIDTRRCGKIFEVDNAGAILKRMIEDHLMIFPVDESGTIFYLHHLFKDFLRDQLEETFSTSDIHQLHCTIAREFEIEGDDVFRALHHFLEGHAFDDAIRLIETHEMKFLLEGKINFLGRCLKKIPGSIIEENPQLLLAQAKLLTYFGNPGQAAVYLTRAHQLFKKRESKGDMVKCLVELGFQYYFTGYVKEAKRLMEQVLHDVEKPSTTYSIAMTYLTFLSSVLGEFETAEKYYKIAWEEMEGLPDVERRRSRALINTSYSYTLYNGAFEQAQQLNKKLLKTVLELNLDPCLPLVYYQLSATSFYLGTFEKGVAFAKKGIEACEKISLSDSRKGWICVAWAQNCMGLGKLDQAIELIDCGIELFEEPGNRWGMANAWECLHQVYLARGKAGPARRILDRAIDIIDGYGLVLTEGILGNSRAGLLMIDRRFSNALDCLESAGTKLDGAAFHLFNNHLLTSRAYFESGDSGGAIKHLSSALLLSENNAYDRFLKQERDWLVPLLKGVWSKDGILDGKNRAYLETLFKKDLPKGPAEIKIVLLGRFKLTVGGTEIPLSKWKSSKALMILKYLAANRHLGFIPREVLIELLWPDEDIQKTGSRFNMAMSALRKTLEPNLPPKLASAYIERKKDTYRLYPGPGISIDAEHFSDAAVAARAQRHNPDKALETSLLAQSFYRGPFLEEDRYEEWCIQKREQFAADYLKILKEVAAIYETQEDVENAVLFTKKILETDPFDETAFKKLMTFYGETGRLSKIKETYITYEKMTEQMDCPVSSDIQNLYHRLIRKAGSI